MPNREWLTTDYYADLGVARGASAEEIAERYREQAWALHPDRSPDPQDADAFKRIARAYAVLGSPTRRAAYDATRDEVFDRGYAPVPGTTRPAPTAVRSAAFRISPRAAMIGGIACIAVGLIVSVLVSSMMMRDARIRSNGVAVTAVITAESPQALMTFATADGTTTTVPAPRLRDRRNGGYRLGERVEVRYLAEDPTEVVPVESTVARDVTMWIIAAKLLVCGPILIGFAVVQRRRRPVAPPPAPATSGPALAARSLA